MLAEVEEAEGGKGAEAKKKGDKKGANKKRLRSRGNYRSGYWHFDQITRHSFESTTSKIKRMSVQAAMCSSSVSMYSHSPITLLTTISANGRLQVHAGLTALST